MAAKKTPARQPIHPAAEAAESDKVRLMREFESLSNQLRENKLAVNERVESNNAALRNCQTAIEYNNRKRAQLLRQRRVIEASLTNCRELLDRVLGEGQENVTSPSRMCATEVLNLLRQD